jgi:hypothetical protein
MLSAHCPKGSSPERNTNRPGSHFHPQKANLNRPVCHRIPETIQLFSQPLSIACYRVEHRSATKPLQKQVPAIDDWHIVGNLKIVTTREAIANDHILDSRDGVIFYTYPGAWN